MPTLGGVPQGPSHRQCSGAVRVETQVTCMRVSVSEFSETKATQTGKERIWREKEKPRESESEHARCEQNVLHTSSSATFSCAAPMSMAAHRDEREHTPNTQTHAAPEQTHKQKSKKQPIHPSAHRPTHPHPHPHTHARKTLQILRSKQGKAQYINCFQPRTSLTPCSTFKMR